MRRVLGLLQDKTLTARRRIWHDGEAYRDFALNEPVNRGLWAATLWQSVKKKSALKRSALLRP